MSDANNPGSGSGSVSASLKDMVVDSLSRSGKLAKIRAELRASVYSVLAQHQQPSTASATSPLLDPSSPHYSDTLAALSLVKQLLTHLNLSFSASVLDTETAHLFNNTDEHLSLLESLADHHHLQYSDSLPLLLQLLNSSSSSSSGGSCGDGNAKQQHTMSSSTSFTSPPVVKRALPLLPPTTRSTSPSSSAPANVKESSALIDQEFTSDHTISPSVSTAGLDYYEAI